MWFSGVSHYFFQSQVKAELLNYANKEQIKIDKSDIHKVLDIVENMLIVGSFSDSEVVDILNKGKSNCKINLKCLFFSFFFFHIQHKIS